MFRFACFLCGPLLSWGAPSRVSAWHGLELRTGRNFILKHRIVVRRPNDVYYSTLRQGKGTGRCVQRPQTKSIGTNLVTGSLARYLEYEHKKKEVTQVSVTTGDLDVRVSKINVPVRRCTRAIDDCSPDFEPWSSKEEDTLFPKNHTTQTRGHQASTDLTCIGPHYMIGLQ
ncbi:hypothetical protein TNCV_4884361 [Trichonephila clavipes]|nr:hypothetical protein TNCV_4884361 [Trichonephila clavipes]